MKRRKRSKPAENCPAGSPTKRIPGGGEHSAPPVTATSAWKIWLAGGLIALATAAAFSSSFTGAFVFDDDEAIVKNPHDPASLADLEGTLPAKLRRDGHRPAIAESVPGRQLRRQRRQRLELPCGKPGHSHLRGPAAVRHRPADVLAAVDARSMGAAAATPLALVIALLWAVHPLQTESVTYIVQRAESLMGLFYLLTLYCFIRGADSPAVASAGMPHRCWPACWAWPARKSWFPPR